VLYQDEDNRIGNQNYLFKVKVRIRETKTLFDIVGSMALYSDLIDRPIVLRNLNESQEVPRRVYGASTIPHVIRRSI
jgi:hypothetical protein